MTVRVTETLRGRMSYVPPYNASIVFEVSGVTDENAALTAVDAVDGTRILQAMDVHPRNVALICKGPAITERKGPDYWVVQCDFDFQGTPLLGTVNPLSLPTEFSWSTIQLSEPSDTDAAGRVLCDSAGNRWRDNKPYVLKGLRARKAFPLFDPLWWTLENTKNAGPVTVDGIPVQAEHMLCKCINPEPYFKSAYTFLWVNFEFEVCLSDKLGQSKYPFDWRFLDAGQSGWYSDSGTKRKARFSNGKGLLVEEDVLLDGAGLPLSPIYSSVKVGESNAAPVAPPSPFDAYQTDTGTGTPAAKWRYFEKATKANHAALPIW